MKELIILIDNFINKKDSYDIFYSGFSRLYCIEPSIYTENEEDFVSNINDRLAYAGEDTNDEDKKYGFINADEFREWLKEQKQNNIHFWNKNNK